MSETEKHDIEKDADNQAEAEAEVKVEGEAENGALEKELSETQTKLAEHQEAMLRLRAEMENLRKRNLREVENARKFALERFMGDLLEVRDSLERGLEAVAAGEATLEQLKEGKELTHRMLIKAMSQHGLVELNPEGEKFDPEKHEAMSLVPSEDVEPDTIVTVVQKGYMLNERLIRPARVLVARGA